MVRKVMVSNGTNALGVLALASPRRLWHGKNLGGVGNAGSGSVEGEIQCFLLKGEKNRKIPAAAEWHPLIRSPSPSDTHAAYNGRSYDVQAAETGKWRR
jgi:hypothetical protein